MDWDRTSDHDEPPLRFLGSIARAIEAGVKIHEQRFHGIPEAIPFPDRTIPDDVLAYCLERFETDDEATLHSVAQEIEEPSVVLSRELARYVGRLRSS